MCLAGSVTLRVHAPSFARPVGGPNPGATRPSHSNLPPGVYLLQMTFLAQQPPICPTVGHIQLSWPGSIVLLILQLCHWNISVFEIQYLSFFTQRTMRGRHAIDVYCVEIKQ